MASVARINNFVKFLLISLIITDNYWRFFKSVLSINTNLFFNYNQQSYARWTMQYTDNIMKVAETHPDLFEIFQQGYFGFKRTTMQCSKQPIYLVLVQTINADAARRHVLFILIIQFINGGLETMK